MVNPVPAHKTALDLNGNWELNKSLSTPLDGALSIQGIGWLIRKTMSVASITLHIRQFEAPESPADAEQDKPTSTSTSSAPAPTPAATAATSTSSTGTAAGETSGSAKCIHIDIDQVAAGLKGTHEARCLDGKWRSHEDWLFGKVRGQSRLVSRAEIASGSLLGTAAPDDSFLLDKDVWETPASANTTDQKADDTKQFIYSYVESKGNGWTAVQIWGFGVVEGVRRHVRLIVVRKQNESAQLKLVYDFTGEN